ncbi:hypothetical protein VNI00_015045 [Paramarasmius palmivorus]|uniref:Uncharacterized protein n=1 Tax=Paramarasmius palmivorus TaxID=297713 RepID=A0AAW0BN60_9AGAR
MSLPLNLGMGLSGFVSVTHLILFHRVSFHNAQVFWDVIRSFENLISLYWASTPDPLWIPCEVATPLTLDPRLPQHLEQITICSFILHEPAIFDLLLRLRHQIKYWGITEVDSQIELPRLLPYLGELFATADAEVQHWMFVLSDAFVESTDGFTGIDDLDLEEEGVAEFCSDINEHIDVKKNTYVQSLVFRGRLWRCLLEGSILKLREGKTALKTVIFEDHWAEEYDDSDSEEEVL